MSLFDGELERIPDRPVKKSRKKTSSISSKAIEFNPDESLVDNRYGIGTRSAARTTAADRTRDERKRITAAYESGELVFDCEPDWLQLCYCANGGANIMPGVFGHQWHKKELAQFEFERRT